ncbi:hypothetical protein V6N13_124583 [Hibiscus sabdariffa]
MGPRKIEGYCGNIFTSVLSNRIRTPETERVKRESDYGGRDESKRQRAESQWIVAARPLCHLQYPVAYLSRLQRILPAARWKLRFRAARTTCPTRVLRPRPRALGGQRPLLRERADIEGSKSNVAMNAWLPQASYPCGHLRYLLTDVPPQPNSPPDNVFRPDRPAEAGLGSKKRGCAPLPIHGIKSSSTGSSFPADSAKPVPLAVVSLDSRTGTVGISRIPLVRTSSESTVRRPGKAPEGAVPSPSPGRHAATRSRRGSSSSSAPAADGFGTGTPVPSPQSQSFSRGYGSILPTSLAYIVPSTRGCSPWRPDAVMSTTGRGRHSVLRIFKGRRGRTGHHATCGALPAAGPYLRLSRFQGGQAVKQKR